MNTPAKPPTAHERETEIVLAILAGEPVTLFGQPARITVAWPEGLPMGMDSEEQLREYAANWLAEVRGRTA